MHSTATAKTYRATRLLAKSFYKAILWKDSCIVRDVWLATSQRDESAKEASAPLLSLSPSCNTLPVLFSSKALWGANQPTSQLSA